MTLEHKCFECGFHGIVAVMDRKVQCPVCDTINDFWLEGEIPPLNHTEQIIEFQKFQSDNK